MTPYLGDTSNATTLAFRQALKAHIAANTVVIALPQGNTAIKDVPSSNYVDVAAWYNQLGVSAPTGGTPGTVYWSFKSLLGKHDYLEQSGLADADGTTVTGFDYASTGGYINRAQGERDAFELLFNSILNCKPFLKNVQAAMDDIFSGNGAGAVNCRTHFRAMARRQVTIVEHLLGSAAVIGYTNPVASGNRGARTKPDVFGAEGVLTEAEITAAKAS